MWNDYTAEQLDSAENLDEIIAVTKDEIVALKDFIAKRDAETVRAATEGVGTDEGSIVSSLCSRTKKQLDRVDQIYHRVHESSLQKVVSKGVGGNLGKMVNYSLMGNDELGAEMYTLATQGLGTKDHVLIDLVNTRTNAQLAAVKDKWEAKNNKSMLDSLNAELSGHARKIMAHLLLGKKNESHEVDEEMAERQAAELHEAGVGKMMGTDDDVFIEIIGGQSRAQIQAIKAAYEKKYEMSLMKAIDKECRGTYKRALLACLFPSTEAYIAYALFKSFEGVGTDTDRVCRMLGGTDKRRMPGVASCYLETYGSSIVEELKDALSGSFLQAALCWVANSDPTRGMEYVTDEMLEINDPEQTKELTKALLQERTNLIDFICQVDAGEICAACKGMGTNDALITQTICSRSKPHLAQVDRFYHHMYKRSLEAQVKQQCFGVYKEFLVYCLLPEAEFNARMLKKAMDGLTTNKQLIISVLAPLSNDRILAARAAHDSKYETPLIDRVKKELRGSMEDVVCALIRGERREDEVDDGLAENQAEELYNAGVGKRMGTDEMAFIRILTGASRPQIQLIRKHYEANHGMSLEKAIEKECSGPFATMLEALCMDPIPYYALQLKEAFNRMITDNTTVARVIGGNDKPLVREIDAYYRGTYGESLAELLKQETSGRFRRAVLTWVCNIDPLETNTSLQQVFEGLPDDDGEENEEAADDEEEDTSEQGKKDLNPEAEPFPTPPVYYTNTAPADGNFAASTQAYGAGVGYGTPQYYQAAPQETVYYQGSGAQMGQYAGYAGMGMTTGYADPAFYPPEERRIPQPPPEDDDEEEDGSEGYYDDGDDDFYTKPIPGATEKQMSMLRTLSQRRSKAVMDSDPVKVNQIQERIKHLKWQISTQSS